MFNGTVSEEAMIYYLDNYGNPLIAEYSDETAMMLHEDHYKWHSYLFLPGKDKVKDKEATEKKMNEFMNYALVTEDGKQKSLWYVKIENFVLKTDIRSTVVYIESQEKKVKQSVHWFCEVKDFKVTEIC